LEKGEDEENIKPQPLKNTTRKIERAGSKKKIASIQLNVRNQAVETYTRKCRQRAKRQEIKNAEKKTGNLIVNGTGQSPERKDPKRKRPRSKWGTGGQGKGLRKGDFEKSEVQSNLITMDLSRGSQMNSWGKVS